MNTTGFWSVPRRGPRASSFLEQGLGGSEDFPVPAL